MKYKDCSNLKNTLIASVRFNNWALLSESLMDSSSIFSCISCTSFLSFSTYNICHCYHFSELIFIELHPIYAIMLIIKTCLCKASNIQISKTAILTTVSLNQANLHCYSWNSCIAWKVLISHLFQTLLTSTIFSHFCKSFVLRVWFNWKLSMSPRCTLKVEIF